MSGTLFLVATPIGNLDDVTRRALDVLGKVRFVVCEDTRHSRILLGHYGLDPERVSLPAFAERSRAAAILERLEAGEDAALVTDAGTPGVSDPGAFLVAEAVAKGIRVIPIPGPSAVIAALCASGLPTGRFHFLGFLPRKGPERTALLEEVSALRATLVIYESARRLVESLAALERVLGDREACVARELTKVHETFVRGRLSAIRAALSAGEVLGEVVVLVEGRTGAARWGEAEVLEALRAGLGRGERLKALSLEVARNAGWPGKEVYRLGLSLRS